MQFAFLQIALERHPLKRETGSPVFHWKVKRNLLCFQKWTEVVVQSQIFWRPAIRFVEWNRYPNGLQKMRFPCCFSLFDLNFSCFGDLNGRAFRFKNFRICSISEIVDGFNSKEIIMRKPSSNPSRRDWWEILCCHRAEMPIFQNVPSQ